MTRCRSSATSAVYTLNLILLRTYLADQAYTLDEPASERPIARGTG